MQLSKKMRTVLVGCGGMSGAWLDAALTLPDVEIVGLVDIVEAAARKRAVDFHLPQAVIGSDFQSVLEQTAPDVVFNCTIPEAHYAITLAALRHGCHVLSEKPLANSLEQGKILVEAAQQANKIFAVIQNRRYDAQIRRMAHFLTTGALGPLTTVNSDFYIGAHFGGFREQMKHVILLDMAIHSFDAARLLTGADPVSVYCQEWNPAGSWYEHDASAIAIFEMSNGLIYTYRGSWCAEGLPTTWECDWRFIGQQGSATWNGAQVIQAQVVAATGTFTSTHQDIEIPAYQAENIGGHAGIIREFFACIQNGTQPETNAADNLKSLAMVFGAIESAESGQKVMLHS
ncbi:Gfo/Idh/MocA family protein [Dictyobacter arantiisoli]|uniref:Oxidoreductase n=1 Tax=Dictyobacter arantiisoli TaxID=2014874 RepID=A0A5A5T8E2_9CHLR|nr:Gfo/Idh/MocA family oxidoreductase [Dictyobacter arantiisoli]GCF07535.1 oxidoreductase [Dictyobacter arantiisoli]